MAKVAVEIVGQRRMGTDPGKHRLVSEREARLLIRQGRAKRVETVAAEDLEALTVPELKAKAEADGVEVKGTGKGGNVLKADLVRALGG